MKLLFAVSAACIAVHAQAIDIGARRELMVDHHLISALRGAELRLQTPRAMGVALKLDRAWEGPFSGYATVIRHQGGFRMYYRGRPSGGADGDAGEITCYAESPDGVHWTKPASNVVLRGAVPYSHNFTPFLDTRPGVPAAQRWKALAGISRSGLAAFISSDGLQWKKMRDEPVLPPSKVTRYDSQNLAFWSAAEGRYVAYFRVFKEIPGMGRVRWVARTTSPDFLEWEEPVEMSFHHGDAAAPAEHLYTNQTSPYFRAPHISVSIAARFLPKRQVLTEDEARAIQVDPGYFKDASDAVLFTTRGGARYDRTFLESFLRPGLGMENWTSRTNYPALNVVQTGPAEMSFYVNRNYGQPTAYIARYALRLDGFAALHAGFSGGEMLTRPLRFSGSELELNYSTSAAGGIRVEIQDENGAPIPGYALEDSREIIGDQIERTASWKSGSGVAALAGRTVRLRFALKDSDLFSFRFR
ncbi:MAG: hypothetical protein R2762_16625 [Bryobacteraceae bacterium]